MKLFKGFLALVILAAAVGGFVWLKQTRPTPPQSSLPSKSWPVAVVTAMPGEYVPVREVFADVVLLGSGWQLQAPFAAWVRAVPVKPGDQVQVGTSLVKLDATDAVVARVNAEAQVAQLEAKIALTRQQLKARQKLARQKLAGELDVETFRQQLKELQVQLKQARAQLKQVQRDTAEPVLKADADVRITEVKVAAGQRVNVGQTLVMGYRPEDVRYQVVLPESVWRQVETHLHELALTDGVHQYAFDRAAEQVSPLGKTLWFRADNTARLGDLRKLTLKLPPLTDVVALPYSALYGEDHVYLVQDGILHRQPVQWRGEIRRDGKTWALLEGVPDGAQVMITHLPNAIDGLRVKVSAANG
ncbi:RND family efflux transporter, MFP subunit [Sulfurivirga caldicuralii]|uniref:RND family efflux transporter, MFP subunit n=1 Tax=Sulfurivirga caldicuralii TaxID=364032 RepID=A0A1N6GU39_9GAMM|nr:hypothetical protein [Sulfurivirga caldicuralii]SIO10992.1 RND family efflux transporter, MFP subunit [Sulfurivirga caldicuralii]